MEWLPAANPAVVKLATPLLRGVLPEMAVPPSKKITVPVAEMGATLAVNVSAVPDAEGFVPAVRFTLMLALGLATVCRSMGLVDAATLLAPV